MLSTCTFGLLCSRNSDEKQSSFDNSLTRTIVAQVQNDFHYEINFSIAWCLIANKPTFISRVWLQLLNRIQHFYSCSCSSGMKRFIYFILFFTNKLCSLHSILLVHFPCLLPYSMKWQL